MKHSPISLTTIRATRGRELSGRRVLVHWLAYCGRSPLGCGINLLVVCVCLLSNCALAQKPSSEDINAANNPLTPKITLNFQDQGAPSLYDIDEGSNAFLFRGVLPHKLAGIGQIFRCTLPIVTAPDGSGTTTGLGDLNIIDLMLFRAGHIALGAGPQLTFPTATHTVTGTGKWQAGVAGVLIAPKRWGLAGALVTWQHSFAGDSNRGTQNNLSAQPLLIYNLPGASYLRSTATWNFDIYRNNYAIPLGAGLGKVWLLHRGTTVNVFAEPQFTVAHNGVGQARFQVFGGVNLQFPIGKK